MIVFYFCAPAEVFLFAAHQSGAWQSYEGSDVECRWIYADKEG